MGLACWSLLANGGSRLALIGAVLLDAVDGRAHGGIAPAESVIKIPMPINSSHSARSSRGKQQDELDILIRRVRPPTARDRSAPAVQVGDQVGSGNIEKAGRRERHHHSG